MIWTFHKRLWLVAIVHTFIGEAGPFLAAVTNYFQPFVMHLANSSISEHYHHQLTNHTYAWTWSSLSAIDTVGNFVGKLLTVDVKRQIHLRLHRRCCIGHSIGCVRPSHHCNDH